MARSVSTVEPGALRQAGVTLVELMVALAVALILSLSVLGVLEFSTSSNQNAATLGALNNNVRAMLTLLTRDVGSAGFMLGAAQSQCALTLTQDSRLGGQGPTVYPVWAQTQTNGTALPFATASQPAANSPGYPTAHSGIATDVLLTAAAPSVPQYVVGDTSGTLLPAPIATAAYGSWSSATMADGVLQLSTVSGLTAGDMALLQVPMQGGLVCMRVPITSVGTGSMTSAPGATYMPSGGYNGFGAVIPISYGTLGVGQLQHARVIDLGASQDAMHIDEYWIDNSSGYPVLMRSEYNGLTDQLIESDAIAPGVVSLQALFGTVPQGAAAGTAPSFKKWSSVNPATDQVVSVALAVVTRSLYDDRSYTAPASISIPEPASGSNLIDSFSDYAVSAAEAHRHFQVSTVLVQLRDTTWN